MPFPLGRRALQHLLSWLLKTQIPAMRMLQQTTNLLLMLPSNVRMPDFHLPISVREMDTDAYPLNPDRPWSPLAEGGAFDIDVA
jgi:hypothetical protein